MIGILDSGSGGLTVLKALREELPSADVLYFGDIKNAPYGSKTQRELSKLTIAAIRLLQARGATKIVSACNSVSASLAVSLLDNSTLTANSLVEMVGPTASYFKHYEKRIALCATPATISSGMYENIFEMLDKKVVSIAIPDLAKAIEFGESQESINKIIAAVLQPVLGTFDALILACTHYPLVRENFEAVVGPGVLLFDPAIAVAERAQKMFWPQEVGNATTRFLISQQSEQFEAYVQDLFPHMVYTIEVLE